MYLSLRHSILVAQERWRMHAAKSQLGRLKQEAKEVGALVAKTQKAQEQVAEARRRNEELEAQQLQMLSEKKSLTTKVRSLERTMQETQAQFDEARHLADEAERLMNDKSKVTVAREHFEALEKRLIPLATNRDSVAAQFASIALTINVNRPPAEVWADLDAFLSK